jgi:hypothetical protein
MQYNIDIENKEKQRNKENEKILYMERYKQVCNCQKFS